MLVFDINGTLLKRILKKEHTIINELAASNIFHHIKTKTHLVYLRPHLDILAELLHSHNVPYTFWSTCLYENTKILVDCLAPIFTRHIGFLSQNECSRDPFLTKKDGKGPVWLKDLSIVKKMYGYECVLIDDSFEKCVDKNNLVLAESFHGFYDDYIIELCGILHKYSDCCDFECIKKYTQMKKII